MFDSNTNRNSFHIIGEWSVGDLRWKPDHSKRGTRYLDVTKSDSSGSFITFTVPTLNYWDMIFLEDNISSSDYNN